MDRIPITTEDYSRLVSQMTPPSRHLRGCVRAFWVGGVICSVGQALTMLAEKLNLNEMTAPMFVSVILIFIGTTLTGIGVYDQIGRYAGAGSVVPITGFANSVAAPAIEFRREGIIMGIGARIFQIAGPVLTYGIVSSMLVGLIHFILREVIA
ncbi:MAG: stage V sporulation protein AC [Clostridia bacterium]|nr:stage V sporulation protein AC [Clostridia bacterium]